MKLEFSPKIFGNTQIRNAIKISAVGDELFHGGGQTDRQT